MSVTRYGLQFRCDLCFSRQDAGPLTTDPDISYWDMVKPPEGWSYFPDLQLRDNFGADIKHLCPECGKLTMAEIAPKLMAMVADERSA
ncbi:MAG: hypothetical protein M0030_04590 [Actinomycetota bacterium]|nr:hypothetical protein [Actinomycetota bacterium]